MIKLKEKQTKKMKIKGQQYWEEHFCTKWSLVMCEETEVWKRDQGRANRVEMQTRAWGEGVNLAFSLDSCGGYGEVFCLHGSWAVTGSSKLGIQGGDSKGTGSRRPGGDPVTVLASQRTPEFFQGFIQDLLLSGTTNPLPVRSYS